MEAVPGLLRAASFRRRMVSSCSGLRITDPPAAWAARPLGLTALPVRRGRDGEGERESTAGAGEPPRSEEHTSELQSLMRISYAVFCLKKQKRPSTHNNTH